MFNGIYKKCLLCKEFVQKNKFSEHNNKYHLKEEITKPQDNSSPKQKNNNNNKEIGKIKFSKIIHHNQNLNTNKSKENFKKTNQVKSNKDKNGGFKSEVQHPGFQ